MYYSINVTDRAKYEYLLSYIFKECDEVSMCFPILNADGYNDPESIKELERYEKAKNDFLHELYCHGARKEISNRYNGMRLCWESKIIRVKPYPQLYEKFKKVHFYDWLWTNAMPEDPCFYKNGICRFMTISHEEQCYLCDKKADKALLAKMRE